MTLLEAAGALRREDRKSYRHHTFTVPAGTPALRIEFRYDPGGDDPHGLMTLQLFGPGGFRGAGHRYAPHQVVELGRERATPGFVIGEIEAGEWTLEIDVHCVIARPDGAPNQYTLRVDATPSVGEQATVARAGTAPTPPRIEAPRWLRGELHLHSTHSDGRWTTGEMAALARHRDLDFMFLTDHNTTTGVDILRSEVGDAIRVLPGIELTTYAGHALALGADTWVDWRTGYQGRSSNDMARGVHDARGFMVIAHPDAPPDDVCTGCQWTHHDFAPALADAVEIWGGLWNGPEERNQGCLDLWRAWLNTGGRFTATAATDAHRPEDWQGDVPATYIHASDTSLPVLLEALRAGRTYVSCGPFIEIRALGVEGPVATVGEDVPRSRVREIEIACVQSPEAELRLVGNHGTVARGRADATGHVVAALPEGVTWCCAELWTPSGDAMLAATSPIYLR